MEHQTTGSFATTSPFHAFYQRTHPTEDAIHDEGGIGGKLQPTPTSSQIPSGLKIGF